MAILFEIDKLGRSEIHGDPQSNLLEILDPAQNNAFTDNYLDFPIDLSKILFICSANTMETISQPLLDRMDVIHLSSYTFQEKKQIYKNHIYPRVLKEVYLIYLQKLIIIKNLKRLLSHKNVFRLLMKVSTI